MNNLSSSSTLFQTALERYKNALNCFNHSDSSPNKEQIIEILSARDELGKLLEVKKVIDTNMLSKLIELDLELQKKAHQITEINLAEYRISLPNTSQSWFSEIEAAQQSHPWSHFDWLIQGAKILIWTVNIALITTLATRFLTGGSGFWEVAIIALPGIISLLKIKIELVKTDKTIFFWVLKSFKEFPNIYKFRKLAALFFSTLFSAIFSIYGFLLIVFILVWDSQPWFSEVYKKQGKTAQNNQNLVVAEQKYLKAIALDSDNFDAHYKLGFLYEELQEFDQAKKEYIIAIRGKHLPAYNNLAYWYIRQENFLDAIALLERSWDLVGKQEQPENFKQLSPKEQREFKVLKYNLAKNLGWALLEAEQDEEAEIMLSAAIGLANDPELKPYVRNPGAAHCLYAKLLEKQTKQSLDTHQINNEWQNCKDLIQKRLAKEPINTEEYKWLYEAKQKLRNNN